MDHKHFVLTNEAQIFAAEEYLAAVDLFRRSREDFAAEHGASAFRNHQTLAIDGDGKITAVSIVALKFDGDTAPGFVRSEQHNGLAIPDQDTVEGRAALAKMAALPPRPVPLELCQKLGVEQPVQAVSVTRAVQPRVESMAREIYVSFPKEMPLQAEQAARAEGIQPVSPIEYQEARVSAESRLNRPRRMAP